MAHINYIKLFNYFKEEENLPRRAALRNIWRVGNLPKEFKSVALDISEGHFFKVANFSVDGVTMERLIDMEGMKYMQALFFLDWLRREPVNARSFMASRRLRTPVQEITDDERQLFLNALVRAKEITGKEFSSILVPEDNSGNDIDVEKVSEQEGVMTATPEILNVVANTEVMRPMIEETVDQVKKQTPF